MAGIALVTQHIEEISQGKRYRRIQVDARMTIAQIASYCPYRPINNRINLYLLICWQGNELTGAPPNLVQATLEKNG
jgi:hypothetical protein